MSTPPSPGMAEQLANVTEEVAVLRVDLDELSEGVAALVGADGSAKKPSRWSWRHADAETATALWVELTDWVDWLVGRYELTTERMSVPTCWYQHPVAVEEFTALMSAWQDAYYGQGKAPRVDLIAWHDRWLWPCLRRLGNDDIAHWVGCMEGRQHVESTLRGFPVPEDRMDFITRDVAARLDIDVANSPAHSGDLA